MAEPLYVLNGNSFIECDHCCFLLVIARVTARSALVHQAQKSAWSRMIWFYFRLIHAFIQVRTLASWLCSVHLRIVFAYLSIWGWETLLQMRSGQRSISRWWSSYKRLSRLCIRVLRSRERRSRGCSCIAWSRTRWSLHPGCKGPCSHLPSNSTASPTVFSFVSTFVLTSPSFHTHTPHLSCHNNHSIPLQPRVR